MPETASTMTVARAYEAWGARLVAYAVVVAGAREAAEDAVHTVFAHLAARPALLQQARDPAAYLFSSVRRAALSQRARPAPSPEGFLAAAHANPLPAEDLRDIERAVAELPEDQREAVTLRIWSGLTFPQMSEATGVSERTLESRFRAALDKLRTRLRKHHE